MIRMEPGIYVRPVDFAKGQGPKPTAHGFSEDTCYRVLGAYAPSELGEYWLMLANNEDELWFITNQHWRVVGVYPEATGLRFPLSKVLP